MVTSTLTPDSVMMEVICLTISERLCRSMLLVDPHLETIPSLSTTFSKSSLYPCSYSQNLSRHLNPCFQFEILFLHTTGQLSTNLLQRLLVAADRVIPIWWITTAGSMEYLCLCVFSCLVVSDSLHPMDCSLSGSSVHEIFPARILEWVANSSSRDLPDPGIEPMFPALAGRFLTIAPPYSIFKSHSWAEASWPTCSWGERTVVGQGQEWAA